MSSDVTIDICVFMSAITPTDPMQADSVAFLRKVAPFVKAGQVRDRQSPLFDLEYFAVRNRRRERHDVERLYRELWHDPLQTEIEPFTREDAQALQLDHARHFPYEPPFVNRGADLMMLAVARKHDCTIVTWDQDLLKYGAPFPNATSTEPFARVIKPPQWIEPAEST